MHDDSAKLPTRRTELDRHRQADLEAAKEFYGGLFGWKFTTATPPQAPFQYVIAHLDDQDVAGIGQPTDDTAPAWHTYIAVDDADAAAEQIQKAGGRLVAPVESAGEGGRNAGFTDPAGAAFRVWQAKRRLGAQAVNVHGSWNFSDYHTSDPGSIVFYANIFGWEADDLGFATLIRKPGYGDHLVATIDPGLRTRQAEVDAPPAFEDAIAWVAPTETGQPHWHVSFAVNDRDESAALAQKLGAAVLSVDDSRWTRAALIRDPQGATFTLSQYTP